MVAHQHEQIEYNQQLLITREQRLNSLKQHQENLRVKHFKQQQTKHLRLKTLQNQIKQQKNSNSTFGLFKIKHFRKKSILWFRLENELDILKQIFLNKEDELIKSVAKVDELTKQLEQIRRLKLTTNQDQSQNKNQLDKLKQELIVKLFSIRNYFYNKK
jgi:hypothetical protein